MTEAKDEINLVEYLDLPFLSLRVDQAFLG